MSEYQDELTGEPLEWAGVGRKPQFAKHGISRDLNKYTNYVETLFAKLLSGGDDPHLGHFASPEKLKAFAYRLQVMTNRSYNACKAAEAASRRRAAQASQSGPNVGLCTQKGGDQKNQP